MPNRPSHISRDQIDYLCNDRSETQDAQLMVHKNSTYPRAAQKVVHVVNCLRQISHLVLQFGIDRSQFLVYGLQFLLGGLQLFVGRLQFLVN